MKTSGLRKTPQRCLTVRHIFVTTLAVCITLPAFGQFKSFKSKSRFGNAPNQESKDSFTDDTNNKNTFGNRTKSLPPIPKSKFVNLNPETAFGPEVVENFDYPDTDIMEMTKDMQKLTGINLILGKDVKGKVSITAPTPITVGDAWKAYLTALEMAGFTLVKSGAFYKIINARDVRYSPTKIYTGNYTPETDTHIMKIMALKNVDASEISRNFRPFMSRYGRIIDLKQTNTVIVSDTGNNVSRLEKLIKFLDVPGHEESLQIIPVKNTSASEIAKLVDEILQGGGNSGSSRSSSRTSKRFTKGSTTAKSSQQNISKIIAEPRTNSIIAMANSAGAEQLRNLIDKLDVKFTSTNSDKIHVLYLNYGNAEELSKTLSTLVSGSRSSGNARARTGGRTFIPASNGSTLFNGEVKITADKNNNALVVTAAPTDWLTIQSVIAKLDIPRDQVYVEGLIMETTLTKVRSFGVNFLGAYGKGNAQRAGFVEGNDLVNLLGGDPTSLSGFFAGVGGPNKSPTEFDIGGNTVKINSVNALIKAVASNTNSNVLATPQILALDNTEAEFEVGRTVPVRNLSTTNSTTNSNVTNQEAKMSLKITPQINKVTRFVKLQINQSFNDFLGDLDTSGNGQATTTRSAVTEVIVRDKDTIAMGGLLRDKETVSVSKVPLLGDIPVLGWLFKSKGRKIEKVNLLMFLTPTIISPYDNEAAQNSLARLEDRTKSLKEVLDDETDDPHKNKVKQLSAKLNKQSEGPLYDSSPNQFQRENNSLDGIGPQLNDGSTPDYQSIMNETQER